MTGRPVPSRRSSSCATARPPGMLPELFRFSPFDPSSSQCTCRDLTWFLATSRHVLVPGLLCSAGSAPRSIGCSLLGGHLDSELNEAGKNQAILVADRLSKEPKFAAVYSSDLKRAAETAHIIANRCHLPEVILDPDLRERHLGDLQGMVLRDASKLKPEAYRAFCSSKQDQEIPGGGESVTQLHQRCTSCVERIAGKHIGERILIVTHGGVLRELYKRAVPVRSVELKVVNTSVNVFHIYDSENKWIIKTWSDISHLQESGFLKNSFGGDKTSG